MRIVIIYIYACLSSPDGQKHGDCPEFRSLSRASEMAAQKLRDEFKVQEFDPATKEEYAGLGKRLRDTWGFDLAESR